MSTKPTGAKTVDPATDVKEPEVDATDVKAAGRRGTLTLTDADMAPIYRGSEIVGSVPKHWADDMLPQGVTRTPTD